MLSEYLPHFNRQNKLAGFESSASFVEKAIKAGKINTWPCPEWYPYDETLLSYIILKTNDTLLVKNILQAKADPNIPSKYSDRFNCDKTTYPLDDAFAQKNINMIELLLEHKADLKYADLERGLDLAIKSPALDCVKLAISLGTNITVHHVHSIMCGWNWFQPSSSADNSILIKIWQHLYQHSPEIAKFNICADAASYISFEDWVNDSLRTKHDVDGYNMNCALISMRERLRTYIHDINVCNIIYLYMQN